MPKRNRSDIDGEILLAARARLLRHGVSGTRIEDIIEDAKVAKSTFYRRFGGMDDIISRLAIDETLSMAREAAVRARDDDADIPTQLARILASLSQRGNRSEIGRLIEAEGASLRLINLVITRPELMERIAAPLVPLIERGQRGGVVRTDVVALELAEWLARNMAALIQLPPRDLNSEREIEGYVLRFVIPAILYPAAGPPDIQRQLGEIAAAIARLEGRIAGKG